MKLSFIKKEIIAEGGETTQATQAATQANQRRKKEAVQTVYTLLEIELGIINLMKKQPTISQKMVADELSINYNTVKYYVSKLKKININF